MLPDLFLDRVALIPLTDVIIESASRLPDPMLRSLSAIHLATALLVREDVDALLSYENLTARLGRRPRPPTASPA